MTDKIVRRIREAFEKRRVALNELNFVYKRLLRMLPRIGSRSDPPLSTLLQKQHQVDESVHHAMVEGAVEHGHVPGPCVCEEAAALTNELHLAARISPRPERASAVVEAMRRLRLFLVRTWWQLLEALPDDVLPELRKSASALQQREAEQHREVVAFGQGPSHDDDLEERTG